MTTRNIVSLVCLLLFAAILAGCERNSTFSNSITFEGKVYLGQMDTTKNILIVYAPLQNATVTCDNFPEKAKTASDGSYSLSVKTVRTFRGNDSDTYTIQAFYSGGDESITVTGKPGDTVTVRDFIIYEHTTE
ncbi:MAG: hypothetical protein JW803_08860 [Endomicrobiales bacterium]|nr:hypothetical protein [Endomicrobiales bacterium]